METLAQIVEEMIANNQPGDLLNNPMVQFGPESRQYMGATILPTRMVEENFYKEENIQYKTIVANDGTRYSPVQVKDGKRFGSFTVELADQDMGAELTSRDHDTIIRLLGRGMTMEAMENAMNWFTNSVVLPLEEKIEVHRWTALADAAIYLRGDNDYSEDVLISNPAGHRITIDSGTVAAPAGLYDNTADPLEWLYKQQQLLSDKGYTADRIFTSRRILNLFLRHPKVVMRKNTVVFSGNQIQTIQGRISRAEFNSILMDEGLPAFEINDMVYNTSTGTKRFLRDTALIMVASTGRTEEVKDPNDDTSNIMIPNTLGYVAMGRPSGEGAPGRAWHMEMKGRKPRTIYAEAWQTTLPVITDPEAIAVLNFPYPTP